MNAVKYVFLLGLVGLLTGCLTPEEMGYLASPEPVYTTPVATPVYNTSPAYYATPVSGYSTMTVYDGYHPGYGGPHYPHHRPPPHGDRPDVRGGHGGHTGSAGQGARPGGTKTVVHPTRERPKAGEPQQPRLVKSKSPEKKQLPGKVVSGKGASGKGGTSGKVSKPGQAGSHGKGVIRKKK